MSGHTLAYPAHIVILENHALALVVVAAFGAWFALRYHSSPWRKLPPGPPGFPIIGNLLDLRDGQWFQFTRWKRTYGDVFFLSAIGQPIVVLNTQKAASDLFDRRASIYSDRARNIVGSMISCGDLMLAIQGYGPRWRRMRKAAQECFGKVGSGEHLRYIQRRDAVQLPMDLLRDPSGWNEHLHRTVASAVMSVTYGTPPLVGIDEPAVRVVEDFMARLQRSVRPGRHLVEFLPWMRHIPSRFAKWKRNAEGWFVSDSAEFEALMEDVAKRKAEGIDRPSIAGTLLDNSEQHGLTVRERAWLAATMYTAGSETTFITLAWWVLAMVGYPDTQSRAQSELDAVVGRTRVPTFDDLQRLPYVRAMVREVLRWRPVGPMGIPHRSTRDDWYEGMFIPAGTMCVANVWAINQDPSVYGADADCFNPARHLDVDGDLGPAAPDTKSEGHATYGFGKRLCPGKHIANSAILMDIALMLWACKLERGKDASGVQTPFNVHGHRVEGTSLKPVPFQCSITPRFPQAPVLLAEEREMYR